MGFLNRVQRGPPHNSCGRDCNSHNLGSGSGDTQYLRKHKLTRQKMMLVLYTL